MLARNLSRVYSYLVSVRTETYFSVLTGSVLADRICFKLALARFSTSVLAGFGENGILRFLTHSRDLGEKLCGNDSHGRPASFCFHKINPNSRYRPPMRRFTASTPGRETQRFHMHLLMFSLLQQLQQQNASTQRVGPQGPGAQPSAWKHFAAEAAEAAKT